VATAGATPFGGRNEVKEGVDGEDGDGEEEERAPVVRDAGERDRGAHGEDHHLQLQEPVRSPARAVRAEQRHQRLLRRSRKRRTPARASSVVRARTLTSAPRRIPSSKEAPSMP